MCIIDEDLSTEDENIVTTSKYNEYCYTDLLL